MDVMKVILIEYTLNCFKMVFFLPFQLGEGQPDHGWSSNDISSHLKFESNLCTGDFFQKQSRWFPGRETVRFISHLYFCLTKGATYNVTRVSYLPFFLCSQRINEYRTHKTIFKSSIQFLFLICAKVISAF